MNDLGWTRPGIFDAESRDLDSAIARYHTFLDLCSRVVLTRVVVPTLDIDLVWHTHMLRATDYRTQTKKLLGRILNHDDKVEEGTMSTSFDETSQLWKVCGCVLAFSIDSNLPHTGEIQGVLFLV